MKTSTAIWSTCLWFLLHLAAVYVWVNLCVTGLAGWVNRTVLPILEIRSAPSSVAFLSAHLFAFSFLPALVAGLGGAKVKPRVAQFVWMVPAAILAYELLIFSRTTSVLLQSESSSALHYYFAPVFAATDANEYVWRSNPLVVRQVLAQFKYTAPFYASVAYSLASRLSIRTELSRRVTERLNRWKAVLG